MINSLMIPMPIKNFSIPLTDLTYMQFAIPHAFFHFLINCLIVYTGLSISDINNTIHGKKETTFGQKFAVVVQATLTIGSLVAMCVIGGKLYRRLKQFKQEEALTSTEMSQDLSQAEELEQSKNEI